MKEITVHTENQLKMDFDAFLRSFKQNRDSSFAFLLGAGASISSGVQSAEDCIWDWKKLIYISNNPTYESFLDIHADYCRKRIQLGLMDKEVIQKKNRKRNMFFMRKTHSLSLEIEQSILRVYVRTNLLILVINFCAFSINMEY